MKCNFYCNEAYKKYCKIKVQRILKIGNTYTRKVFIKTSGLIMNLHCINKKNFISNNIHTSLHSYNFKTKCFLMHNTMI
jgi:hypothetical protein